MNSTTTVPEPATATATATATAHGHQARSPSPSPIPEGPGSAQESTGISLVAFVTALTASLIVFGIQMGFFLLLRNKLVRILCVYLPLNHDAKSPFFFYFIFIYLLIFFNFFEIK